jgi:hypothetical protein
MSSQAHSSAGRPPLVRFCRDSSATAARLRLLTARPCPARVLPPVSAYAPSATPALPACPCAGSARCRRTLAPARLHRTACTPAIARLLPLPRPHASCRSPTARHLPALRHRTTRPRAARGGRDSQGEGGDGQTQEGGSRQDRVRERQGA